MYSILYLLLYDRLYHVMSKVCLPAHMAYFLFGFNGMICATLYYLLLIV